MPRKNRDDVAGPGFPTSSTNGPARPATAPSSDDGARHHPGPAGGTRPNTNVYDIRQLTDVSPPGWNEAC